MYLVFMALFACSEPKKSTETEVDLLAQRPFFSLSLSSSLVAAGDSLKLQVTWPDTAQGVDSLLVLMDGAFFQKEKVSNAGPFIFGFSTSGFKMGRHRLQVAALGKGRKREESSQTFQVRSAQPPDTYTYEIVQTYPHDPNSFTQGLEWYQGQLFEGTGLNGKSAVMQVDLLSGNANKKTELDSEYFGEGITLLENKLYQLTWQNRKGFVYQLPELKQVEDFAYPTDGWGLCKWKGDFAMTDGSNQLYFHEKAGFRRKGLIEVWDNNRPIVGLNELETVGNSIWANKYTTDTLVQFDPETGRVLAYADLSGLLKEADRTGEEDVLNGIAYKAEDGLYYVTGKNWPRLFAIRLVKKKVM